MLTPKQREERAKGIGGSDVPALLGVEAPGRKTIIDVWARKRRGPNLELDPLIVEDEDDDDKPSAFAPYLRGDARDAGSILEGAVADLYSRITGLDCAKCRTLVGRRPWHRANVDRVTGPDLKSKRYIQAAVPDWHELGVDRGVEIKLVGGWASRDWPDEGIPDYVRIQCQWYMGITGLPRWDVMALLAGTDPRIVRVQRDEGLILAMEDLVDAFWADHVLADVPPPTPGSPAQTMAVLRATMPDEELGEVTDDSLEVAALVGRLVEARRARKLAKETEEAVTATLAARTGRHEAMVGDWGRFKFSKRRGSVDWKGVAHELAEGGVVPDELVEEHRREGKRVAQAYPKKRWIENVLDTGRLAHLLEEAEAGEKGADDGDL
jgi:predicted phage-related endonuclease